MGEPVVIPRSAHRVSRQNIDPDALKVLYRLRRFDHTAYLVGGSVRDLLLDRQPKDFDIGTSAHPYQIKRLFRNCWIIGRRFRLAHVKFGNKTIEVATFRRQVTPGSELDPPEPVPATVQPRAAGGTTEGNAASAPSDRLIHRDNTFGSPEEDAFRRDFTINALFYDVSTFSVIDYVGGIKDLEAGWIRSIGDPGERFLEDPVRMVRAIALSARLDFRIHASIYEAIRRHRAEISRSAPARMLEEYYKILRAGAAEETFRRLADVGLLEHISPELHGHRSSQLWSSLRALDTYRQGFWGIPETLTNPVLLGSMLVPIGFTGERPPRSQTKPGARRPLPHAATLGKLPVARRDVEQLCQVLGLQQRLTGAPGSARAQASLTHRTAFRDALIWLEVHGHAPEAADQWRRLAEGASRHLPADDTARARRRRRRRRRPRRASE